jgi:hypothetical protein
MVACDLLSRETELMPKVLAGSECSSRPPGLQEERERIYSAIFGECDLVYRERLRLVPHIDVYRFPPTTRRPFFTFVTAGMSDLPMSLPEWIAPDCRRAELVFYAAEDNSEYPVLLLRQAHFPHENASWILPCDTRTNGSPPRPVFRHGSLDCLFFPPSPVEPESRLGKELSWEGEQIKLLWCVPISTAECNLIRERGVFALTALFKARSHPFIYAGDRASYV